MKAIKFLAVALACAAMAVACNKPEPETVLEVSLESLDFAAASPASQTITVTANKDWTAEATESWITITPTSGTGNGEITVTVTDNAASEGENAPMRSGEIYLKSAEKTAVVSVYQNRETIVFVVDKDKAEVPAEGASVVIAVQYNTAYEVDIPSGVTWITKAASKAVATANVTLAVAANETYEAREATVSLIPAMGDTKTVKITQAAAELKKLSAIASADDFAVFAKVADKYTAEETVTLTADITIPADTVSYIVDTLRANFVGGGHTITYNLTSQIPSASVASVGLFGVVKGKVSGLKVAGSITFSPTAGSGTYGIGGVAGRINEGAVIDNCENNVKITGTTQVTHHIGGIVGDSYAGTVTNCVNKATVGMVIPERGAANASQIGGIIGHIEGTSVVSNCTNDGTVIYEGKGTPRIGGICGYINFVTNLTFDKCTNNGEIVWNEGAYTASSWSYVGGLTGYYGTPQHDCTVTYKDCVNNGDIKIDITETKSKTRCGGIACHAGISNTAYAENELTWTMDNCVNNGNIVTTSTAANNYFGGIIGFAEKTAKCIFKDCANNGCFTCPGTPKMGAIFGGMGGSATEFNNVIVDPKCTLTAGTATTTLGLLVGDNNAFTTKATGKVAGTISNGGTETVTTAENYASYLAGTKTAMGEGWDATGVVFNGSSDPVADPISGTYKVANLKVLGGVGSSAFVEVKDKSWMWNSTVNKEYDNLLVVQATGMSGTTVTASVDYQAGENGAYWDYVLLAEKNKIDNTKSIDVSANFGWLPHSATTATINLSDGSATINGKSCKVLTAGEYPISLDWASAKGTVTVPENSIALLTYCTVMDSSTYTYDSSWSGTDFDRFAVNPLVYAMIFTKQ